MPLREFLGESDAAHAIREKIAVFAREPVTVLIQGETGTGKEMVARLIHEVSDRSEQPYIPTDCSSIPDSLIESEFFGHTKGSFTSAARYEGIFAAADRGTLFLDEIGDMPCDLQTRLLRFLSEAGNCNREVRMIGSAKAKTINVRIVAATNQNLSGLVREKKFRKDLFYRINALNIVIPPLRDRRSDILIIAREVAQGFPIAQPAKNVLLHYGWPGNVRELQNVLSEAKALAKMDESEEIQLEHIHFSEKPFAAIGEDQDLQGLHAVVFGREEIPLGFSLQKARELIRRDFERPFITKALVQCKWNRKAAASLLSISYRTLLYTLEDLGIEPKRMGKRQARAAGVGVAAG